MLSLIIYLLAGLATSWQIFRLIMWSVWGRPVQHIEEIALFASVSLVVVSFFAIRWPKVSAIIALFACVILWLFYAPAMRDTLSTGTGGETLREMVEFGGASIFMGTVDMLRAFVPALFLV